MRWCCGTLFAAREANYLHIFAMTPTTIVEKNEAGLLMILNAMDKLNKDRFIEGIRYRFHDAYEIGQMVEYLRMCKSRLNTEYKALIKFSTPFIPLFATQNNKCFQTAESLFNRIRSTLAQVKEVFKKMTEVDRTPLPAGQVAPSVFGKSALVSDKTQLELFGLETFPREAQELMELVDDLFTSAGLAVTLCLQKMREEDEVRNDPVLSRQSYEKTYNDIRNNIKVASRYIPTNTKVEENELDKQRKRALTEDEKNNFCQKNYHVHDYEQMEEHVIHMEIELARNEGLTEKERFFWKDNREKALRVRRVIENFHLVQGAEGQRGKLSSKVLVQFLKWCGVAQNFEYQLYKDYFMPTYLASHPQPLLAVIGWSSVDRVRGILLEHFTDQQLAMDFESKLSSVFSDEADQDKNQTMLAFEEMPDVSSL